MPPRKSKKNPDEALNSVIRKDGAGEDAVVRDLHEKLPTATNLEAVEIALALQQLIKGQNSMLANQTVMGEEIAKLKQHMAEVDATSEKYNNDQKKFIEDVLSKSASLKKAGDEKDKIIAQGANTYQKAVAEAKAAMVNDRLKFEEELAHSPMVTVVSPGDPQIITVNGHMEMRVLPEEIRIKHKVWILKPNEPTEVPDIVAKALQVRRKSQQETYERQAALQKNLEQPQLESEMRRINAKYGSNGGIVVDS